MKLRSELLFRHAHGMTWRVCLTALWVLAFFFNIGVGQQQDTPDPQPPVVEPASDEAQNAIAQFKFPDSLDCELYAAEPDVANVVAFHRDYLGRMFICETFRQEKGVEDNRSHPEWMDAELAALTVKDRIDYIRKHIPDADQTYTANDDRIRLLMDQDGDGKPDRVTVFADKFNRLEMGTGAGVLSYRNNVYYTCIPDLFQLQDTNGDGVADQRKSLQTGFGVRFAFRGHDMHGLIVGPDGRLYFSIGDRGYNVSKSIRDATSGAVFRCELDGSHLEVVATGLRNPQELAFDAFGNLFTGDNNSDSGDKARWTEILPGGDSGWRMYYQYLADRGPFNREKIWHPFNSETPAYIIPPIANISDGPSGLAFYPGTGFAEDFTGRFFLCDFRGDTSQSGVRSFRNRPLGAYWEVVDEETTFWNMLVTDIDFGSDGKFYVSDWVFGWQGVNKGRIYAFFDREKIKSPIVQQVETLLRDGLKQQSSQDLQALLGHADQRVRQEAQFELVGRKDGITLKGVANDSKQDRLARIHAIWGLGQLGRTAQSNRQAFDLSLIKTLLSDQDWSVAAAAATVAGELNYSESDQVAALLTHPNLRLRLQAALALETIGTEKDLDNVVAMLVENGDADPLLRHGGVMALLGIFQRSPTPDSHPIRELATHESPSVRIALCVAMRKLLQSHADGIYRHRLIASQLVVKLLADSERNIVLEAARVIHDVPVESEMNTLADLIHQVENLHGADPLVRRILNANTIVGTQANAVALAEFAANKSFDEARRIDAIDALGTWAAPPARDAVLNDWRPLDTGKRNVLDARNAMTENFPAMTDGSDALANAAIRAAGALKLTGIGSELAAVALSTTRHESTRVEALKSLKLLEYQGLNQILADLDAGFDALPALLAASAIELTAVHDEQQALLLIEKTLFQGELATKQSAIRTLGSMQTEASTELLNLLLSKAAANDLTPELRLDVTLAAENRKNDSIKKNLKSYADGLVNPEDPASSYIDTRTGGDGSKGSQIFFGKTEVSCVRCHRIDGTGGEIGPELSGVGLTRDRAYLVDAIVNPNKVVTEGFAQVKALTEDGVVHVGLIKQQNEKTMVLLDADGKETILEKASIEELVPGQSSMPDDLIKQLSKQELRDLVEFLANRKTPPTLPTPAANTEHQ